MARKATTAPVDAASSSLGPIVQVSTPAIIARRLREAIASGEFQPGQQMLEASFAARLDVSRGPLREAMQRLTQEGLLVSHRNRGLFVMELDDEAMRDIYLARGAIERTAVRTIVTSGRGADAAELVDIVDAMREYETSPADPQVSALDMQYHEALVALSRSPRLILMHGTLLTQVRLCLARMQGTYDTIDYRVSEHTGIAHAMLDGDADLADRLLMEHMDDGLRRVLVMVRGQ